MEATYVTLETNSRHFIVEISTSIVPIKDLIGTHHSIPELAGLMESPNKISCDRFSKQSDKSKEMQDAN